MRLTTPWLHRMCGHFFLTEMILVLASDTAAFCPSFIQQYHLLKANLMLNLIGTLFQSLGFLQLSAGMTDLHSVRYSKGSCITETSLI